MRLAAVLVVLLASLALPAQGEAEIYKCRVGERTIYQGQPCAQPTSQTPLQGTLTVVEPFVRNSAPTDKAPPAVERSRHGRPSPPASSAEQTECQTLRDRIRQIDAAARQKSTPRLAERRRAAKDKLWALGCAERDPQ